MKFRLEATPEELQEKGLTLVKALGDQLGYSPAELSELLKADAIDDQKPIRNAKLRKLYDGMMEEYARQLRMLEREILNILEE